MDEARLVSTLADLTGLLSPAGRTPPDALNRARRLIAETIINGQAEPMEDPASPGSAPVAIDLLSRRATEDIRHAVHDTIPAQRDPFFRTFLRTWPVPAALPGRSVPAWAAGWAMEESMGPFQSEEGGLVWFDFRRTSPCVLLVDSQSHRPFVRLPMATLAPGPPAMGATVINIPAGSVWLAAPLFDANAPAGSFAGLRIRDGILTLSHAGFISGNVIAVHPGVVVTLQLRPDSGPQPARARHGGDARKVSAETPERVTYTMSVVGGARLIQADPATLEMYGNRLHLRNLEGVFPRYDKLLGRLLFPMSASADSIEIDDARSQLFRPERKAAISEAGWALPVAVPHNGDPRNLGEGAGAGGLVLSLAKGLRASIPPVGSSNPIALESALLLGEPGQLSVTATTARVRYRRQWNLWSTRAGVRGQIELQSSDPLLLRFDASAADTGGEALSIATLQCSSHLDRPVTAAGQRVPFISRRAVLDVMRVADVTHISLAAPADPARDPVTGEQTPQAPISFALSNAIARVSAALALQLHGALNDDDHVDSGVLTLHFALGFLLPSLPDPYAANVPQRASRRAMEAVNSGRAELIARVRWSAAAQAAVSFDLGAGGESALRGDFLQIEGAPPIQREPTRERDYLPEIEAAFSRGIGQRPELFRLLDVSSRADLFGVGYGQTLRDHAEPAEAQLRLRGLDLIASARNVTAFTLPAFQWEPVYNIPAEGALPFPSKLVSPTDGGATRLALPIAQLVPVAPIPVVDTFLHEYGNVDASLLARFTLPFGMVAAAELRPGAHGSLASNSPRFESVRPDFAATGLSGGLQLVLAAPVKLMTPVGGPMPGLPGATVQTDNSTSGQNVLKSGSVDITFNGTFANKMKLVPVSRIDLSGYGASIFSDWRHMAVKGAGVTQVKFEALIGRTSREVVQVRSTLYPWGVIVVRTITMERTGSGGVFRRDSGWQAASDGDYDLDGCVVHPGVLPRLKNVRRIRDTTNDYERVYSNGPDGTVRLTKVLFDADVEIEGVTLGANDAQLVPTRDIVGYVQILPVNIALTADQLADLLIATGPIGGPIDCELNIAQSGLHMRLSRIEVDRTSTLGGNPQFVAVARGTPELPDAGQWSFAYRGPLETEPHRLQTNGPLPLIRANPTPGVVPPYRFADASELHRPSNPDSEYALLHSSDAQRMLVPQPQVRWSEGMIHSGAPLLFADMYTLAGTVALFPRPDQCHPLPAGSALRITGRRKVRLDIPPQGNLGPGEFHVVPGERTLTQGASLRARSRVGQDSTIALRIDSHQNPNWSCSYGPVSVLGDVDDLSELLQVIGTLSSSATSAPEIRNPQLKFGSVLSPVQAVIDFLTLFGLPFPFNVSVTNATFAFKTGIKYKFPDYFPFNLVEDAIKHGFGVMLELELSASFGKESENFGEALVTSQVPIASAMTPWMFALEFESKMLSKVLHPIPVFIGGTSKFELEASSSGENSKLALYVGVAGVAEADLKILEIQAGRSYTIVSRVVQEKGEVKLGMGVSTQWEAEGDVLEGYAEIKLSFELLVIIERGNELHCTGEATLAIDLTVCWALTKTFEVEFTMSEELALAAFVAATVLP